MKLMEIHEALKSLDVKNDALWTGDGLPRVEFVSELVGKTLTRQEITDAAPGFTRENPIIPTGAETVPTTDEVKVVAQPQEPVAEEEPVDEPAHVKNQRAIRAWIKGQHENRVKRAAARAQLLKGLNPSDVAKSPLDEAMSRSTKRGDKRPNFDPPAEG